MTKTDYKQLRQEVDHINTLLREKKTEGIDQQTINRYFDSFRKLFIFFAQKVKAADSEDQRKKAMRDVVGLNGLYGIQLVLGADLPADLEEIAYDYDHDDYPGYEYRLDNILGDNYLILGGKGHKP